MVKALVQHGISVGDDGIARAAVWAPAHDSIAIELDGRTVPLARAECGWWAGELGEVAHGARYWIVAGDRRVGDPGSRWQPDGVHGASAVVDDRRVRVDDGGWKGRSLDELVVSEIHVGTFSPEGTFAGAAAKLPLLADAGITAVEVMPLAEFPGARNWGYDGVFPSAIQSTYGGPEGFAGFVRAAHANGLAVIVDVVYNHLGPEGNVLGVLGPYFTDAYRTPWGDALNFDGAGSDEVRALFVQSASRWVDVFGVDGLRLDAVHAIVDPSARPFVAELSDAVHQAGEARSRDVFVIAESSANDPRVVAPPDENGFGCDSVWNDDFHHALHVALTGERQEYYVDYRGAADVAEAMQHGFVLRGRWSPFRGRHHGRATPPGSGSRFVVFTQNHDHIGNRPAGDRLVASVSHEAARVAAAAVLLAPNVPLLFMGEEWSSATPFPYFTSHTHPELAEAVRRGRTEEFAGFFGDASVEVPDPQAESTFEMARLDWSERDSGAHGEHLAWCRALLALRRERRALANLDGASVRVWCANDDVVVMERRAGEAPDIDVVTTVLSFADAPRDVSIGIASPTTLLTTDGVAVDGTLVHLGPYGVAVLAP